MIAFRIFLAVFFAALFAYTLKVGFEYGWNLIPPFFAEMQGFTWQGQFNFDFMGFLLLSAIWCAWRNNFTPLGFGIAILGVTGGMLFLTAYLIYLSVTTGGDIKTIMLGVRRASA